MAMETQFAPMKSLGYPSQELVSLPAKDINKKLANLRKQLQKDTGFGLAVKSYDHAGSRKQKNNRSRPRPSPSPTTSTNGPGSRADGWNVPSMGTYGHVVQDRQLYSPTKYPGSPFQVQSPSDRLLSHSEATWPPQASLLSLEDQKELINEYYLHYHPQLPLINRGEMETQLEKCRNNPLESYLSPLFFYSVFTCASQFSDGLCGVGDICLKQALAFREVFFGYPCVSSVIALLLLSLHLERIKQKPHTSFAWALAGEAFTMVQDLGLHKLCNVGPDPDDQELAVRTFWAAFTSDRLVCVSSGRPFTFDEKDIDVTPPRLSALERAIYPENEIYMRNFNFLIDISKVIGRVVRFNYSAQSAQHRSPSLHQEAMLSTLDSWIASLIKETNLSSIDAPQSTTPFQRHFDTQKTFLLYCMLILLHQPYVDDLSPNPNSNKKNAETRPSFDICSDAATIITDIAYRLPLPDIKYLANWAETLYAVLTATRVHLMNASFRNDAEATMNGEINFLRSMAVLGKLNHVQGSSLSRTMQAFQQCFDSRSDSILSEYAAHKIREEACTAVSTIQTIMPAPATASSWSIMHVTAPVPTSGAIIDLPISTVTDSNGIISMQQQPQPADAPPTPGSTRSNGNNSSKFIQYQPSQAGRVSSSSRGNGKPSSRKKRAGRQPETPVFSAYGNRSVNGYQPQNPPMVMQPHHPDTNGSMNAEYYMEDIFPTAVTSYDPLFLQNEVMMDISMEPTVLSPDSSQWTSNSAEDIRTYIVSPGSFRLMDTNDLHEHSQHPPPQQQQQTQQTVPSVDTNVNFYIPWPQHINQDWTYSATTS